MREIVYILGGLISGVAAGMGMGGGTILIPALTLLGGLGQHAAQGVNMLAFVPAAAAALFVHAKAKRVDLPSCLPVLLGGVAGALPGVWLCAWLSGDWLRRAFGAFLLALCIGRIRKAIRRKKA
ncbi:MAG: sulfite exporter TauE/SafE family protein [Clostridia bacterium]|nr:sulfite exporter TauE/SafE family protein [Clostridia bacterium]